MAVRSLWIGTYPPAGIGTPPGRGEGIYRIEMDLGTGELGRPRRVVETPAPSFLAQRPDGAVLYATDESETGRVAAFRVHDEGLEPLGTASSGGSFPCHLLLDGDLLYVANYGDGALGVLHLAADGRFVPDEPQVLRHAGAGPDADRQEGPHAHFVARAPGGHVLVVDLGTDQLRRYVRTSAGLEPAGVAATLPPGTGPRHLVLAAPPAPSPAAGGVLAYLTGELDATVHVLAWDAATGTAELVQSLPASPAVPPDRRPAAAPAPSHLELDGRELVVGVRGAGALSRFTIGDDGLLTHRAHQPLPGGTPRHLAVVGDRVVVAEQVPGAVTVLDRSGAVTSSRPLASAACVLAAAADDPAGRSPGR